MKKVHLDSSTRSQNTSQTHTKSLDPNAPTFQLKLKTSMNMDKSSSNCTLNKGHPYLSALIRNIKSPIASGCTSSSHHQRSHSAAFSNPSHS